MITKFKTYLHDYINKNIIFHLLIYFLLVFLIPFCNKIVIFSIQWNGIFLDRLMTSMFLSSSIWVFVSDIIIILICWFLRIKFKLLMKNIILIYIYNKLLLPFQSLLILLVLNYSYNLIINIILNINSILMIIFTLICFSKFNYENKLYKYLLIIIILLFSLLSRPIFLLFY